MSAVLIAVVLSLVSAVAYAAAAVCQERLAARAGGTGTLRLLRSGAWWWFVPPGLLIALLGMGLSLVNFSIDEVINPRLANVRAQRRRERRARRAARPTVAGPVR